MATKRITDETLANLLGVATSTVVAARASGSIPVHDVSAEVVEAGYSPEAVQYILEQRAGAAEVTGRGRKVKAPAKVLSATQLGRFATYDAKLVTFGRPRKTTDPSV